MHYLTNYYKNLSEQLQEKVNFLETQLNEYLVRSGEKDGKKGTFYGPKFVPDEGGKKGMLSPLPFTPPKTDPNRRTEKKPSKPGIQITPQRKPESIIPQSGSRPKSTFDIDYDLETRIPMRYGSLPKLGDSNLIGKVPMLGDTDAINVMPEPDRDELNIMPAPDRSMSQSEVDDEGNPTGLVRVTPKKPKVKRFGDSGPKIRPTPIKPQGSQIDLKNIDFRNYEPIKLIQNERGKFKEL
jgi:hypothetical protein